MSELRIDSLTEKEKKRLLAKICVDTITGCWNWTGQKIPKGYGTIKFRGRVEYTHRVMFALHKGPLPRGRKLAALAQIDHLCKNCSCCNPEHMEVVTRRENILRSDCFPAINFRKTHCIRGHLLPVREDGKYRQCVQCRAITDKARRDRKLNGPDRDAVLAKDREEKRIRRAIHPDTEKEIQKRYSESHREQIKERSEAYRLANRDKINERQRATRLARLAKLKLMEGAS